MCMESTETTHLLGEFEDQYVQASTGRRFVNLLVDSTIVQLIVTLVENYLPFYPEVLLEHSGGVIFSILFTYIVSGVLYGGMIGLMELLTNGRSPGKYLSGTRAIMQDGRPLDAKTAFLRGLIRYIPFEVFSALGSPCFPWHDRWTKTYVIDIKASVIIQEEKL